MRTLRAEIILNKTDLRAIVDDDDFFRFGWMNWYLNDNGYVVTDTPRPKREMGYPVKVRLHRLIVQCPDGMDVDHINGDKLDNRKENLRICTRSENLANKESASDSRKRLKGAYINKRSKNIQWSSSINIPNSNPRKQKHLGYFKTEEEAHEAYKNASLEIHGEFSVYRSRK